MLSTVPLGTTENLSLQGFLKQNPWSVKTQLENILLNEDSSQVSPN